MYDETGIRIVNHKEIGTREFISNSIIMGLINPYVPSVHKIQPALLSFFMSFSTGRHQEWEQTFVLAERSH